MKPNEIYSLVLADRHQLYQKQTIIETSNAASVQFSIEVGYETNGAEKVPLWLHVCTPDTGLARDFKFDISVYSLETGFNYCQTRTTRGNMASRKCVVWVNPNETTMVRVSKPKTGFFKQWLFGKPRLWLNVGAHKNSRQFDLGEVYNA